MKSSLWSASTAIIGCGCFVLALLASGCRFIADGQTAANEKPISDGQIVLLRRNNEFAAVVVTNQHIPPEQLDFTWFYRSDGKGTFHQDDPAVKTGSVSNATRIAFATFSVQWSGAADGRGWVYFSKGPHDSKKVATYQMCVTAETDFGKVDATDEQWRFRDSPDFNVSAMIKANIPERLWPDRLLNNRENRSLGVWGRGVIATFLVVVTFGWLALRRRSGIPRRNS